MIPPDVNEPQTYHIISISQAKLEERYIRGMDEQTQFAVSVAIGSVIALLLIALVPTQPEDDDDE